MLQVTDGRHEGRVEELVDVATGQRRLADAGVADEQQFVAIVEFATDRHGQHTNEWLRAD